jgi:hypothetical protein
VRECGTHSPWARQSCAIGNLSDGKIGVIEEALGALNTKRLSYLQRRCIKMLGKQPRQVARPYPETLGERINGTVVQSASLD